MKFIRLLVGLCLFILLLTGCTKVSHNNIDSSAQSQQKAHGKNEVQQRQKSMGKNSSDSAMVKAKIDCSTPNRINQSVYFKSSSNDEKVEVVKVGATGYGAPPKNYYPEGQRRLLTIRASKIDAYRALAEIVSGIHVWGGTAIGDMVIERDRYRTFIDSYVRGARVVSVEAKDDGTYKTIVEMEVDRRFLHQVMTFIDPAVERLCYEQNQDGTISYFGYSTAPSFYYSE